MQANMTYIPANKISARTDGNDASEVLRLGLNEFIDVAGQNAQLYVRHHDAEALHQYRVALRQARSLLKCNSSFIPAELSQRLKQLLKELTEPTGRLRDLEVFTDHLKEYSEVLPDIFNQGARHMQNDLHWEANKYRQKILSWFLSDGYKSIYSDLRQNIRLINMVVSEDEYSEFQVAQMTKQQKKITAKFYKLDTLSIEKLHCLRIMVKNQRYTANFYRDFAKGINIRAHKKVQDCLVLIHDYAMQKHFVIEYIEQKQ